MIALLQRVRRASVDIEETIIGAIEAGVVVFVAVERGDSTASADRLLDRILRYRMFADEQGRMNKGLSETGGGLLLVPQFTLAADTSKGNRPSFNAAAPSAQGEHLFAYLLELARDKHTQVAGGTFGAHMLVKLINDGPVTFWLSVAPPR